MKQATGPTPEISVFVVKDGIRYACQEQILKSGKFIFRCGKCNNGNLGSRGNLVIWCHSCGCRVVVEDVPK